MRPCELDSLSAQCTMISCADHLPVPGRHCMAAGIFWSAALSTAGPLAYRSISASRSAAERAMSRIPLAEEIEDHEYHAGDAGGEHQRPQPRECRARRAVVQPRRGLGQAGQEQCEEYPVEQDDGEDRRAEDAQGTGGEPRGGGDGAREDYRGGGDTTRDERRLVCHEPAHDDPREPADDAAGESAEQAPTRTRAVVRRHARKIIATAPWSGGVLPRTARSRRA